jgi:hypothetical protein
LTSSCRRGTRQRGPNFREALELGHEQIWVAAFSAVPLGTKCRLPPAPVASKLRLEPQGGRFGSRGHHASRAIRYRQAHPAHAGSGRLLEGGPIDLQVRSENTGNVHVRPEGEVTVAPLLWGDDRSLPVPGENVLPSSVRESTVRLDQLPIGIYKASVRVTYGSGRVSAASERQTFVVLPWKLLLGAVGIFLLGGLGSLGLTRLWGRRGAAPAAGAVSSGSEGCCPSGSPHGCRGSPSSLPLSMRPTLVPTLPRRASHAASAWGSSVRSSAARLCRTPGRM